MQGGAATLAERARQLRTQPDLLLATDMLNLPAFLGLTRDLFAHLPVALYCHENQLTYPFPPGEKRDLTYGMINWLSMLAADRVLFNSAFHLEDWFDELPRLLKHFPDCTHLHRVPGVRAYRYSVPGNGYCGSSAGVSRTGPGSPRAPGKYSASGSSQAVRK